MDDFNIEYCDPFYEKNDYFIRVEHLGRYLFACNYINKDIDNYDLSNKYDVIICFETI